MQCKSVFLCPQEFKHHTSKTPRNKKANEIAEAYTEQGNERYFAILAGRAVTDAADKESRLGHLQSKHEATKRLAERRKQDHDRTIDKHRKVRPFCFLSKQTLI